MAHRKSAVVAAALVGATLWPSAAQAQIYPGVRLVATLTGASYFGGPAGDPDGRGTAFIYADTLRNRVCYTITVTYIQLPAWSFLLTNRGGGALGNITTGKTTGCMVQDETTHATINALLGSYSTPSIVKVYNSEYSTSPALWGALHRG